MKIINTLFDNNLPIVLLVGVLSILVCSGYTTLNRYYFNPSPLDDSYQQTSILEEHVNKQTDKAIAKAKDLSFKPIEASYSLNQEILDIDSEVIGIQGGEARQIRLEHSAQEEGSLYLSNVSQASTISIGKGKHRRYVREWQLKQGDKITIASAEMVIKNLDADQLKLHITMPNYSDVEYTVSRGEVTGAVSNNKAVAIETCAKWKTRQRRKINKKLNKPITIRIGGVQQCLRQIALPLLYSPDHFKLEFRNNNYFFRSSNQSISSRYFIARKTGVDGATEKLNDNKINLPILLNEKKEITLNASYSRYRMKIVKNTHSGLTDITFTPISNVKKTSLDRLTVLGFKRSNFSRADSNKLVFNSAKHQAKVEISPLVSYGTYGIIFGFLLVLATIFFTRTDGERSNKVLIFYCVPSALATLATLAVLKYGDSSDSAWMVSALMISVTLALARHRLAIWFATSVMFLLLWGIEYGQAISFAYDSTKYFYDFIQQMVYIGFGLTVWLFAVQIYYLSLITDSPIQRTVKNVCERSKLIIKKKIFWVVIFIMASITLLVQLLFGSETGIGGIQPSELVKLLFILMLGWVALYIHGFRKIIKEYQAVKLPLKKESKRHKLRQIFWVSVIFAPLILYVCSFVYVVHDSSYPVVVLSATLLFAGIFIIIGYDIKIFKLQSAETSNLSPILWNVVFIAIFCNIVFFLLYMIFSYLWPFLEDSSMLKAYRYRVDVWNNFTLNPHSGWQISQVYKLITSDLTNSALTFAQGSVPEIDDDFALTGWFVSRVLLGEILPFVGFPAFLLLTSIIAYRVMSNYQHDTDNGSAIYLCMGTVIYAGLATILAHVVMNTSSNLNWLPVIGQPMPFLGRQGSMLLLFLIPFCIIVTLVCLTLTNERHRDSLTTAS